MASRSSPEARTFAPPPDQDVRDRITNELDRNFLVEAGAGSGKTTALVDRMVALVRNRACKVEEIAAVTFTRKAAAELRQRFQVELEGVLAKPSTDAPAREAVNVALRDLDSAFLGTIHSFCAKLLRERPLEAELDPDFVELGETEAFRMQQRFWLGFLERLAADGDPRLKQLERLGLEPGQLQDLYNLLVENPDVEFDLSPAEPPSDAEMQAVQDELDALLDRAASLMPAREPEKGWDSAAKKFLTLLYRRRTVGWTDRIEFMNAVAGLIGFKGKPTQNRWADNKAGKAAAKELGLEFAAFCALDSSAGALAARWWARRYPVAVGFAKAAADAFAEERKELGLLTFQDDLVLTAEMLRRSPPVRRDLGRRFRRVLVDEFQDTDPIQAEILFLLASEPEPGSGPSGAADWVCATPRSGALFVVGDPKQSIYRFRRADIALYELVKQRFAEFGGLLRLEANFRSLPAVEKVVKGVFDAKQMFPKVPNAQQAAFAPLLVQRGPATDEGEGLVRSYAVVGKTNDQVAEDDAEKIADHIAQRVEKGDRKPGDFMILTRNRGHLALYARVLEEWNLPVEVSGAGVDFEDKLLAFLLLFKCLADPDHAVRVLAVLAGPLFGVTLDKIVAYRDAGGSLAINRPPWLGRGPGVGGPGDDASSDSPEPSAAASEVAATLGTLHEWWKCARREPADVTAERLIARTGLFPLAAAGPLGQLRAGALVYLLDAVRARALGGDASLAGAVEAMQTALEWNDAVVSLVPGRGNAVRLMNLHQAKGLQAEVVFLASPFGEKTHPPRLRVKRGEDGVARGSVEVTQSKGYHKRVLARPVTWPQEAKDETAFEEAEKVRLLYVAATRARDELWVADWEQETKSRGQKKSPWAAVAQWTKETAEPALDDAPVAPGSQTVPGPPEPEVLDPDTDLAPLVADTEASLKAAGAESYAVETVTNRAKQDVEGPSKDGEPDTDTGAFEAASSQPQVGGPEWGSVVHDLLAAVEDGEPAAALTARARNLLIEHDRGLDARGEPAELEPLVALLESVRRSDLWARSIASRERYTEAPFTLRTEGPNGRPELLEGVIDLVFREDDGWVVADYKTDAGNDPGFAKRLPGYRAQVTIYADCWEQITGERVKERVLMFTAQGRTESW